MGNKEIASLNIAITIKLIMIALGLIVIALLLNGMLGESHTGGSCGAQMSQQEKDMYNARVKPYIGEKTKGSEVKSMIDDIISMNQENSGEVGKFIGITVGNVNKYEEEDKRLLDQMCNEASIFDSNDGNTLDDGDNTDTAVQNATKEMSKLKSKINSQKYYTVTAKQSGGLYTWVDITENEAANEQIVLNNI